MGLYKRLLSRSTIAASIAVLSVFQVYYYYHSVHRPAHGSSSAAGFLDEFTSFEFASDDKGQQGPTARSSQGRRRKTKQSAPDPHQHQPKQESDSEPEIKLLLSPKELEWVKRRGDLFESWYNDKAVIIHRNSNPLVKKVIEGRVFPPTTLQDRNQPTPADFSVSTFDSGTTTTVSAKHATKYFRSIEVKSVYVDDEGPWLDFVIIGNPKCGTSTLMANLGHLAPMPVKDVCSGPGKTLRLAYQEWPTAHAENLTQSIVDNNTLLRGSKCPRHISDWMIKAFAANFQKTKFIVGIRHPVLWFNSFWRMMTGGNPYRMMNPCPCLIDERTGKRHCPDQPDLKCFTDCPDRQYFCLHRARMHLPLARLGKTPLTEEERSWLSPQDADGGHRLHAWNISNPIFLYDQTQMKEDSYWSELADFLRVSHIPNTRYHGSKGREQTHKSLCDPEYDVFRSVMMPYSYEMSVWLLNYLVPVARDPSRNDVIIPSIDEFVEAVETYKEDPCNRLIRNDANGAYILNPKLKELILPPPRPSVIMHRQVLAKKRRDEDSVGLTNELVPRKLPKRRKAVTAIHQEQQSDDE
ncbi:hypothetical protein IV203_004266 [Nitzschia inconspicua]|uniref:Sulfotransferase domain-containing protein n=1 Tax=Nitzschia inconspicua TaxID=303405 RepID=A0A9K3PP56_9STRA|nr:hypothetical protein IV203_004266 [Nitzschia inconspicua]